MPSANHKCGQALVPCPHATQPYRARLSLNIHHHNHHTWLHSKHPLHKCICHSHAVCLSGQLHPPLYVLCTSILFCWSKNNFSAISIMLFSFFCTQDSTYPLYTADSINCELLNYGRINTADSILSHVTVNIYGKYSTIILESAYFSNHDNIIVSQLTWNPP